MTTGQHALAGTTPQIRLLTADVLRNLTTALNALLLLLALVVVERRSAGAFEQPLDGVLLVSAVLVAVALAAVVRLPLLGHGPWSRGEGVRLAAPSIALLLLGWSLSLPSTSLVSCLLLWTLILGEEAWLWQQVFHPLKLSAEFLPGRLRLGRSGKLSPRAIEQDQVTQQLTRLRAADGSDVLQGWLRAPLAAGQRTAHLHVAFCPPFATSPRLEFAQTGGPAARIKQGQLLAYGVRLDVKLSPTDENLSAKGENLSANGEKQAPQDSVLIEFSATCGPCESADRQPS
jgi:hypothetical protein